MSPLKQVVTRFLLVSSSMLTACYGTTDSNPSLLAQRFEEIAIASCDCLVEFTSDFEPRDCPALDDENTAACLAEWDSREDPAARRQVECLTDLLDGVEHCLSDYWCGAPICRPGVSFALDRGNPEVLAALERCGEDFSWDGPVNCLPFR